MHVLVVNSVEILLNYLNEQLQHVHTPMEQTDDDKVDYFSFVSLCILLILKHYKPHQLEKETMGTIP